MRDQDRDGSQGRDPGQGGAKPQDARDAGEFAALLRGLKERSGLSFRQLEERAAERGEVLPRSTVADLLRRDALPRPEVLLAFLHACGADADTDAWLAARHRIAAEPDKEPDREPDRESRKESRTEPEREPGGEPEAVPARRPRARLLGLAAVAAAALLGAGGYLLANSGGDGDEAERGAPPSGTYRIRSDDSGLCFSEREDEGAGHVFQADCAEAVPVYSLEPLDGGVFRLRSLHPVFGYGCLGVENGSTRPAAPAGDDYCGRRGTSERFRLEAVAGGGFRIVPQHSGACLTVSGGSATTARTPVVQLACDPAESGQVFRFDAVPSPSGIPDITTNP
ncbi:RICIN domain-containing protein [Kitasatospora sp. NPDC057500]|uniref:RICIN domain-containing protein n=1 Tax=Kitasatospora sp. NPDC057500 TaxID=3346151 RepID=UPI0036B2985D